MDYLGTSTLGFEGRTEGSVRPCIAIRSRGLTWSTACQPVSDQDSTYLQVGILLPWLSLSGREPRSKPVMDLAPAFGSQRANCAETARTGQNGPR